MASNSLSTFIPKTVGEFVHVVEKCFSHTSSCSDMVLCVLQTKSIPSERERAVAVSGVDRKSRNISYSQQHNKKSHFTAPKRSEDH